MFQSLSERLGGIFDKLTKRGSLSEADVDTAMREVRRALLEADVALEVVKDFIDKVKERAIGQEVVKSVTPAQMVIKIVNDTLIDTLGKNVETINLNAAPPVVIMMTGLQGSGKTTTTAKIAKRFTEKDKKKVLMASLDVRRPAAQEQLKILGEQINVKSLPIIENQQPEAITKRAIDAANLGGYDILILDTAGRLHIDEELMAENKAVSKISNPHEILLVADSLTGQDAVTVAKSFNDSLEISGIVLTRIDGDGRGGAALSMRAITGKPVKLMGTGETIDALEEFHPERIAGRILDMGDVVSLVEKAAETIDAEKAEKIAKKMQKGTFDLDDLAEQLKQMEKIGGMGSVLGMLPGIGKLKKNIDKSKLDDNIFIRQRAIISSMTRKERQHPKILNASRKKRIASGSGTTVPEINKLLKMHRQMADLMKKLGKGKGGLGMLSGLFGGGMPQLPKDMDGDLSGLEKGLPNDIAKMLPPGGLGGALSSFPGFPGKKK